MEKKQWVQHVSGQGEKWAVLNHSDARIADGEEVASEYEWIVRGKYDPKKWRDLWHSLPKSEYVLCEPPEVWVDVTEFVQVVSRGEYSNLVYNGENVRVDNGGYRLRKVQLWNDYGTKSTKQWAFIVEQKVTQ